MLVVTPIMNWKAKSAISMAAIAVLIGGIALWNRGHSRPAAQVVVRLSVEPADQLDLVMAKANSARFKYLMGKISNAKPYLAQKLELKRLPKSAHLEARIGLENREEAQKYLDAFVAALQDFCGSQVRLSKEAETTR
jgi:predicted small integral membrane protein